MTPVKFHAAFLPNHNEFNVRVKTAKVTLFEKMTIAKFLRVARNPQKPLTVDGITIVFDGDTDGSAEKQVRDYLRAVADSYVNTKYKGNPNN